MVMLDLFGLWCFCVIWLVCVCVVLGECWGCWGCMGVWLF